MLSSSRSPQSNKSEDPIPEMIQLHSPCRLNEICSKINAGVFMPRVSGMINNIGRNRLMVVSSSSVRPFLEVV